MSSFSVKRGECDHEGWMPNHAGDLCPHCGEEAKEKTIKITPEMIRKFKMELHGIIEAGVGDIVQSEELPYCAKSSEGYFDYDWAVKHAATKPGQGIIASLNNVDYTRAQANYLVINKRFEHASLRSSGGGYTEIILQRLNDKDELLDEKVRISPSTGVMFSFPMESLRVVGKMRHIVTEQWVKEG